MASEKKAFPQFDTDEPLWYNNGKWGRAGYMVPNPGGKTFTNNSVIMAFVNLVGRNLFELTHREDVKFYAPPHKQWLYDFHQLIVTGRKRLDDLTVQPNDSNKLEPQHATPSPEIFLVYPVPFFGERVRQQDIRQYIKLTTLMLGEAMQHSDNEHALYVTPAFSGQMGKYLQNMYVHMATKYFGKTREQAYARDFKLLDADFTGYDPASVLTQVELTEERPPQQWWPTENDLSQIRGMQINEALLKCDRWPTGDWMVQADGNAFPDPSGQDDETNTSGSGVIPPGGNGTSSSGKFMKPPGEAP